MADGTRAGVSRWCRRAQVTRPATGRGASGPGHSLPLTVATVAELEGDVRCVAVHQGERTLNHTFTLLLLQPHSALPESSCSIFIIPHRFSSLQRRSQHKSYTGTSMVTSHDDGTYPRRHAANLHGGQHRSHPDLGGAGRQGQFVRPSRA